MSILRHFLTLQWYQNGAGEVLAVLLPHLLFLPVAAVIVMLRAHLSPTALPLVGLVWPTGATLAAVRCGRAAPGAALGLRRIRTFGMLLAGASCS